jgi:hypothetical protein
LLCEAHGILFVCVFSTFWMCVSKQQSRWIYLCRRYLCNSGVEKRVEKPCMDMLEYLLQSKHCYVLKLFHTCVCVCVCWKTENNLFASYAFRILLVLLEKGRKKSCGSHCYNNDWPKKKTLFNSSCITRWKRVWKPFWILLDHCEVREK